MNYTLIWQPKGRISEHDDARNVRRRACKLRAGPGSSVYSNQRLSKGQVLEQQATRVLADILLAGALALPVYQNAQRSTSCCDHAIDLRRKHLPNVSSEESLGGPWRQQSIHRTLRFMLGNLKLRAGHGVTGPVCHQQADKHPVNQRPNDA